MTRPVRPNADPGMSRAAYAMTAAPNIARATEKKKLKAEH